MTEPKHTGELPAEVAEWLNAERKVSTPEDEASWNDAVLNAAHFFGLPMVKPLDAAILLHGLNPDGESAKDVENITTDDTTPQDFKNMLRAFEAAHANKSGPRTLMDWVRLADRSGCKYHHWVGSYVAHRFGILGPQSPATAPAAAPAPPKSIPESREQRQARRWQMCVDEGLPMPSDTYKHYPRGIGKVAKALGIERQSLTQDLDAHRERMSGK